MKQVAIAIPIYKPKPSKSEQIALTQCYNILNNYPIIFFCPDGLDASAYLNKGEQTVFFSKDDFKGVKAYSKLMTKASFYKQFIDYDYILIYQLDAFVFRDDLIFWCEQGYHYIGAPWMDTSWMQELSKKWKLPFLYHWMQRVGNGGFSLRKVSTFLRLSQFYKPLTKNMKLNEDIFWSNQPFSFTPIFKTPSLEKASAFAFEEQPNHCFENTHQKLPFGCHAWDKEAVYPFWKPIFRQYGYDISFLEDCWK